ncbi:cytochrome-c peroxidase [Sphingobacterium rhinopitheci]|uniref:cytochrome-c peroxidase n=1 Tax=Sphingobacterium rhinopitheci TaxID=2781960 RepID=UPI001F51A3C6|nr:cytochrome c peroxidase [Sphingobacterium rhinopitheci]MCI0922132.1 cytochrome-c peroxidase [Sphingobacterium rhinopitheci]
MKISKWNVLATIIFLIVACNKADNLEDIDYEMTFIKPAHFPEPIYKLAYNSISKAQFDLGRKLFYDPILSRNNTISCGSCHISQNAFTHHGHDLSHGIDDQLGTRNTMPIMNLAWGNSFFWDGGVLHLDLTPAAPIENPVEMDEKLSNVIAKLNANKDYPALFKKAYGSSVVTSITLLKSLGQFMAMLVSANSKYDQVIAGKATFTTQELTGYNIFKTQCNTCHKEPLFTDYSYRNNGQALNVFNDYGRYDITNLEEDKLKFKVPSLRNLKYTAPYMHDGKFYTLESVINHYRFQIRDTQNLDPILKEKGRIDLSEEDVASLTAFLNTLNDESFVNDKHFQEQ